MRAGRRSDALVIDPVKIGEHAVTVLDFQVHPLAERSPELWFFLRPGDKAIHELLVVKVRLDQGR